MATEDKYAAGGFEEVVSRLGPTWPGDGLKEGDFVTGILKDRQPSKYGKENYTLTGAEINGEPVKDKDGNESDLLVWGSSVMCNRMDEVENGKQVKIVFEKSELPKVRGQNPMKMFRVFVKG